jgi:hypothetical protein
MELEVRYGAQKLQPIVPLLNQINLVQMLPSDSFEIHFNLFLLSTPNFS